VPSTFKQDSQPQNISANLNFAKSRLAPHSQSAALDSQVLLGHALERGRAWILAHPEYLLNQKQQNDFERSIIAIEASIALPYVLGHWEFYGLDFEISPDVLIPRPETELLVDHALAFLNTKSGPQKCVDVGTGSGCIPVAITKHSSKANFLALDISEAALSIARKNVEAHGLKQKISCIHSNLLDQVTGPFDLICANLPYIPSEALLELEVSKKEPLVALDGGKDGLKYIKPFLQQSSKLINPAALILAEIDPVLAILVEKLALSLFPACKVEIVADLSGKARLLKIAA